ncbi:hypothetical protein Q4567_06330 [Aliiglaciecola sp. 2_MG-2023]|nr:MULTISPECIES: hypothetical protein [unclassified Aliiglaciecola]MDO6710329.1 hypothetical protein [Aliiglaciecola sp. 2_MG-2023]MDO6751476.1 hypothetical protein [Aliiglaciecola sp. 1_MG-2023]
MLHTNIVRESLDDYRFTFDATSHFTHNEYSGHALNAIHIIFDE